jgi:exonuclease SbcC
MKIEIVQLENIRSHVKSTVPFAKGFNCLVGGLGCGKSSILYSIDFALFGDPVGRSYEYLLREGTDAGKVTVQFVQNGKTYRLSRGLKRRGKGIGQDFDELQLLEDERLISSVKSEAVAEQLRTITGLDRELFRNIVWVKQEQLKDLLNAQPRERQTRLDELFGLSDYESAWSNLQGYQKEYEGERRAYEKDSDVVSLEKLATEYDRAAAEFSLLEIEILDLEAKLKVAQTELEKADSDLKRLEEVRTQNEELRRKEAKILTSLANIQDSLTSLSAKAEGKRTANADLVQRLASMEAQAESCWEELKRVGIQPNQQLEALRKQIGTFDDQISSLKGKHEATISNMQADTKRLSSLSEENRCPLCLQPLNEDYKQDMIQRIQNDDSLRRNELIELQQQIGHLQTLKNQTNTALSNLQNFTLRIEDLKIRIKEETEALDELSKELQNKLIFQQELQAQLGNVHTELNRFDVSKLEAAKTRSRQALQQYSALECELLSKESNKKILVQRIDEMKDRIDKAQQKIERMQKIVKLTEVITGLRDAYRSIQPKLRSEFVKVLRSFVQQVLDSLVAGEGPLMNILIDDTYTPYVIGENGTEREVSHMSGGERTLLAFAYRLGLGQLIMQSRTSHGLSLLLLDEPTESLGREDGSIDRLAEAISRFKAIEQIIAVTHSEAFAEEADHLIRVEKEAGESKVSVER